MHRTLERFLEVVNQFRVALFRRIDALWGYDVFIAHRRADAADYASALYDKLKAERMSCFIDRVVYGTGDSLLIATALHVTKSTIFLLVGSPELLKPRYPVDWVEAEIQTYLAAHQSNPKVLLVDFGNLIADALADVGGGNATSHAILKHLAPFIYVSEAAEAFLKTPSDQVLSAIRKNLLSRRRDRSRILFF